MMTPKERERRNAYSKAYRKRRKDLYALHGRAWHLKQYGLTPQSYEKMMRDQEGCCAICGDFKWTLLFVDHDHTTKKVRGLLCKACNSGIGLLRDSSAVVHAALRYLQRAEEI